jgi:hypothetical protein
MVSALPESFDDEVLCCRRRAAQHGDFASAHQLRWLPLRSPIGRSDGRRLA